MKNRILHGDVRVLLKRFPNELVDCIITSSPYYQLREYHSGKLEIGQEKTVNDYLKTLFNIFMECKRVLKSTGSLWINLGDTYSKVNKSLLGIPFRLATMLLDTGLILRNTIIWKKPAIVPESVKDRFTNDFEYLFFFTKLDDYYFEQQFEPRVSEGGTAPYGSQGVVGSVNSGLRKKQEKAVNQFRLEKGLTDKVIELPSFHSNSPEGMRNKRAVWTICVKPYKGHCGTFPPDLVRTPILATCPVGGLVLDPFMGSGTVAEVAIETNRHYLGIELNSNYIKLAEERIQGVKKRVSNEINI